MFKKLRRHFIILNMSIISGVVLVAFAFVYFSAYQNTEKQNQERLSNLTTPYFIKIARAISDDAGLTTTTVGDMSTQVTRVLPTNFHLSFSIYTDSAGNILSINSLIDMQNESYESAVAQALDGQHANQIIQLDERKWMYEIEPSQSIAVTEIDGATEVIQVDDENMTI